MLGNVLTSGAFVGGNLSPITTPHWMWRSKKTKTKPIQSTHKTVHPGILWGIVPKQEPHKWCIGIRKRKNSIAYNKGNLRMGVTNSKEAFFFP